MSKHWLLGTLFTLTVAAGHIDTGWAAPPRSNGKGFKLYPVSEVSSVEITIKEGKKRLAFSVQCVGKVPGIGKARKKSMVEFRPLAALQRTARTPKLKKRYAALQRAGKKACSSIDVPKTPGTPDEPKNGVPVTPTAAPTPVPAHLSLEPYTGPFGETEARHLFARFAWGAHPQQVQEAVQRGLSATADRLLAYQPEPVLDAQVADIERDTWLSGDPNAGDANRPIDPGKPNEISRQGLRLGMMFRIMHSANPFFERFKFWLSNERLAVSHTAAEECERHALREYLKDLQAVAQSGDYKDYMNRMNNSQLMHLKWLDGAANLGGLVGIRPNENWAREFWELGTVGPTDLNGQPVYSDLDVAQASIAFTGGAINRTQVNGEELCVGSYSPLLHTTGPKIVFAGTAWEAVVEDKNDLLEATFRHPRTAEHLAEDLWSEFMGPRPPADTIRALAAVIRAADYKLLPVFRTLMLSKAFFAPENRFTLVRHPVERVAAFVRISGFPLYYRTTDQLLGRLEQRLFDPPTVFGWNEKNLLDDSRMLEWRNTVNAYFIHVDLEDLKEDHNWSYYDRFVAPHHAAGRRTAAEIAAQMANEFGIPLNPAQLNDIDQLMNYYLTFNGCPSKCDGQPFKLVRQLYDTSPDSRESGYEWDGQRVIRRLVALMLTSRDFFVK